MDGAMLEVDVLIVGGGPAGSAAALALRRADAGLAVAIAEKSCYELPRVGETLSPGVRPLLDFLGLAPAFARAGHLPAHGNSAAWGGAEVAQRDFLLTPFGGGWHLDRRRFDADLAEAAEAAGAACWRGTRLAEAERRGDGWRVGLEGRPGKREVKARFLIDATGKSQSLARRLGARRVAGDRLVALAAVLPAPPDAAATTLVEACRRGWFYSARLPAAEGGKSAFWAALMTDADLARRHRLGDPRVWWRTLREEAPQTARRLSPPAAADPWPPVVPVAAHSARLPLPGGPGWLAAGDAAASYDPLSSSGIGRALESGIRAAVAAQRMLEGDPQALGQLAALQEEEYGRYGGTWSAYYQIERRWPDEPFWRRRQTLITLDPQSRLVAARQPLAATGWPADLRPLEPADFGAACSEPRQAAEIVAGHPRRGEIGDRKLVLGLQWLLADGALALVRSQPPMAAR